jgi:hypothetical protein
MTEEEERDYYRYLSLKQQMAQAQAAQQPPPPPPEKSTWGGIVDGARALGRGGLQGITANFGDEIQGLIGQAAQRGVNLTPDAVLDALRRHGVDLNKASEQDAYQYVRDADRQANAKAEADHGALYDAGQAGGGIASSFIPGLGVAPGAGLLGTTAKMAALGGLSGLGGSNADLTRGEYGRAALDTAVGAGVGGGAGALGYGIGQGFKWAGGKLIGSAFGRAGAADARAAQIAAAKQVEEDLAKRSAAGIAAREAYKPALELRYAGKLDTLEPTERAAAERLLSEYDRKAAAGLLEKEAAKDAASQAFSDSISGRGDAVAEKASALLQPAAKRSAKELFKMYAEPVVAGTVGHYLGGKLDDVTGMHGIGSSVGTAAGLVFGRTRAGKAIANRLALPGTQMSIANALGGFGSGLRTFGAGLANAETGALRAPGIVSGLEDRLLAIPGMAELFSPRAKQEALVEAMRAQGAGQP